MDKIRTLTTRPWCFSLGSGWALAVITLSIVGTGHGQAQEFYVACNKSQTKICGPTCYDPKIEYCEFGYRVLKSCTGNEQKCNDGQCYSPETHVCLKNVGTTATETVCKIGQQLCGHRCYNPGPEICWNDWRVCPLGKEVCGYRCYDPKKEACHRTETLEGAKLCNLSEELCGLDCHEPSPAKKCTKSGAVCPLGEEGCGRFKCYNPPAGEKCFFEQIKCTENQELCGSNCYDPRMEVCLKGAAGRTKICHIGREKCGVSNCFWSHNETCHEGPRYETPVVCPNTLAAACGTKCFDPATHECFDCVDEDVDPQLKIHIISVLCTRGYVLCGRECHDRESKRTACINGTICETGQSICGKMCFDSETQTCTTISIRPFPISIPRWPFPEQVETETK